MARVTAGARIGANIIVTGLVAGAIALGCVAFNSIVPMAWASWSANADRIQAEDARGARIDRASKDKEYALVCKDYFKASFIERNLTYWDHRWCEDYRDRMPGA